MCPFLNVFCIISGIFFSLLTFNMFKYKNFTGVYEVEYEIWGGMF